jgi:hypothetical protein
MEKWIHEAFSLFSSQVREEEKRCGTHAGLVSRSCFSRVPNERSGQFLSYYSPPSVSLSQTKQTLIVSLFDDMCDYYIVCKSAKEVWEALKNVW